MSFFSAVQHIDEKILYFINNKLASPFADALFTFCREKENWFPLYVIMLGIIVYKYRKDSWWIVILVALIILMSDQIASGLLKPLVQRLRPCQNDAVNIHLRKVIDCGGGFSFLSSHAANHFAISFFYPQLFPKQKKWLLPVMMLWAAVISIAQVYVGYHYPSDVFFGAILGLGCAMLVYFIARQRIKKAQDKTFKSSIVS